MTTTDLGMPRLGFFTDTSVCIGCKACEVACKEWNLVPDDGFNLLGMSYDNTGMLGANTWRHVAFIEQPLSVGHQHPAFGGHPTGPSGTTAAAEATAASLATSPDKGAELGNRPAERSTVEPPVDRPPVDLGMPSFELPGARTGAEGRQEFRWLMASDVCKHCTHAGCLDVCPTGALGANTWRHVAFIESEYRGGPRDGDVLQWTGQAVVERHC